MQTDPMTIMQTCCGDSCESVPDEVLDAVHESLRYVPLGDDRLSRRDARAERIAPLMAEQGWRFCPCFPMLRTEQHRRIFDLVHTNLANRLAHKAELQNVA